jgi:hypothetical protein
MARTAHKEPPLRFVSALICGAVLARAGVYLEPNRGQSGATAPFVARASHGTLAAGPTAIENLRRDGSSAAIVFEGASPQARAYPEQLLPGVSHYVQGSDPARWLWDVPHYGSVRYENVYPGIDLLYHSAHGDVEFDFFLRPSANPKQIRMRVSAAVQLDQSGALVVGGVLVHAPVAWQNIRGQRIPIQARFKLDRDRRVSFQLGRYDRNAPLTIDPIVQFATFLGGSGNDIGIRVVSGNDGAIYLAGNTMSADFPASLPAGDLLNRPETLLNQTAFVSRLEPDASKLDWSLFIGGTAIQSVFAMKLDTFGNLYLLGETTSPNFPVTPGAWRTSIVPSSADLFLVKFDAQTGHIITSTFLGIGFDPTNMNDRALLALDVAGGIYVGGPILFTEDFIPTPGALDAAPPQTSEAEPAFVLRLNSSVSAAVYESYWPFGSIDAMDVDTSGNLVIGGTAFGCSQCGTPPFPAVNPLPGVDQNPTFPDQAYIARLNPAGTAVDLASLLNSSGESSGVADLKIASDGSIYVLASAGSPLLLRIAADGKSLLQSMTLNGPGSQGGLALTNSLRLVFLPNGTLCLAGLNLPIASQTAGGLVGTSSSVYSPIGWSLSCEDPSGTTFNLQTDLPPTGGTPYTDVTGTADGSFLFTGSAGSTLVTTPGVVQPTFGGSGPYNDDIPNNAIPQGDAFLMRVSLNNPAPNIQRIDPGFVVLDNSAPSTILSGTPDTCSVALTGSGFAFGATITFNGPAVTGTFIDSGHTSLSFPCSAMQPGDNPIVMALPGPGGGSSNQTLTGINAPPSTISVSPSSVTQGAAETKLVIRARNLSASSTLYWNGSPRTASFVLDGAGSSTGHFELVLESSDLSQPSSAQITVSNPAPGGGISPPVLFTVQPASGAGTPILYQPNPFTFGGGYTLGPQIQLAGTGFAAGTTVSWDGAEIPVSSFTTTQITIQPPAGDLSHMGTHQVYAANGAFQSLPVEVYIGPAVAAAASAYDPVQKRLYVLGATVPYTNTVNLMVFDATTGNLLNTIANIVQGVEATAVSANGQYLYIAGNTGGSLAQILRYNASSGAIDLQWQIPAPAGQTQSGITSMATPPSSPETVIVATTAGDVLIFDRVQQRPYDSISAGFSSNYVSGEGYWILLASATRIYTVPANASLTNNPCWMWMNYDAFGISGGQNTCSGEPPETQHDSGVSYLTDGTRTQIIALLGAGYSNAQYGYGPGLALDLPNRQTWEFAMDSDGDYQLFVYAMDARQLQLRAQVDVYYPVTRTLYPIGNGAVLLLLPTEVISIPASSTAQPSSRPVDLHSHPPPREAEPGR